MSTKLTIPGTQSTSVDLTMSDGRVRVSVSPMAKTVEVRLRSESDSQAVRDAVRNTEFGETPASRHADRILSVVVPQVNQGHGSGNIFGNTVVIASGRNSIAARNISVVNGQVIIDGQSVEGSAPDVLEAEVVLPPDGQVRIKTVSADVEIGRVAVATVETVSGDISAREARTLNARTISGDVDIDEATSVLNARTTSGDITVESYTGSSAVLDSVSGDVRVTCGAGARGNLHVNTVSGDIRVRSVPEVTHHTRSVSGKVTVR